MGSSSKTAYSLLRWIVTSSPHHHHRSSITAALNPFWLHKPTTQQTVLPRVVSGLPSSWSYQHVGSKSIKHISDLAASNGLCTQKTGPILGWQMRPLSTSGVSEASKNSASEDLQASDEVSKETVPEDVEEAIEDSKETRPGWVLKVIVALTVSYMAFHGFPVIGESSIRHSLALLKAEDPIFKRSGASRLALFATTDDRRKSVVKAGGIQRLMSMLEGASEDQTRREAIKALVALAHCEEAVLALREVRADVIFQALLRSSSDSDILRYSSAVLEKLDNEKNSGSLGHDLPQKSDTTLCIS